MIGGTVKGKRRYKKGDHGNRKCKTMHLYYTEMISENTVSNKNGLDIWNEKV